MRTISEVKTALDALGKSQQSPGIARGLHLGMPGIAEADCRRIEQELNIRLPESYRNTLLAYDLSSLELGYLRFFGDAQTIIYENQTSTNPFLEFYKMHHLLEIGKYESDRICIRLKDHSDHEGEIVYVSHAKYPRPEQAEGEFVCSSFERFVVCAATDLKLKEEADYYVWGEESLGSAREEVLFHRIMNAILETEPRARETSFWHDFIRGF